MHEVVMADERRCAFGCGAVRCSSLGDFKMRTARRPVFPPLCAKLVKSAVSATASRRFARATHTHGHANRVRESHSAAPASRCSVSSRQSRICPACTLATSYNPPSRGHGPDPRLTSPAEIIQVQLQRHDLGKGAWFSDSCSRTRNTSSSVWVK